MACICRWHRLTSPCADDRTSFWHPNRKNLRKSQLSVRRTCRSHETAIPRLGRPFDDVETGVSQLFEEPTDPLDLCQSFGHDLSFGGQRA